MAADTAGARPGGPGLEGVVGGVGRGSFLAFAELGLGDEAEWR